MLIVFIIFVQCIHVEIFHDNDEDKDCLQSPPGKMLKETRIKLLCHKGHPNNRCQSFLLQNFTLVHTISNAGFEKEVNGSKFRQKGMHMHTPPADLSVRSVLTSR